MAHARQGLELEKKPAKCPRKRQVGREGLGTGYTALPMKFPGVAFGAKRTKFGCM